MKIKIRSREKQNRKEMQKKKWWPGTGSNRPHEDLQSSALPTELPGRRVLLYRSENRCQHKIRFFLHFHQDPGSEGRNRRYPNKIPCPERLSGHSQPTPEPSPTERPSKRDNYKKASANMLLKKQPQL